jgi:hypothetical protein
MVVMVTHGGYVKRTALSAYRTQNRGGKGRGGMETKDEDFVVRVFAADTHTEILFFSSTGMAYKQKVWRLPLGAPQARGKALINILPLKAGERITSVMPLPQDEEAREAQHPVRHQVRRRAPQPADGLPVGEPRRQDRHEAGRRFRRHRGCAALRAGRRCAADDGAGPVHQVLC